LRTDDLEAVTQNSAAVLEEMIARDQMQRQACWTESLAAGSIGFVERIQPLILSRNETELVQATGMSECCEKREFLTGKKSA
jgi:hypothetical protein